MMDPNNITNLRNNPDLFKKILANVADDIVTVEEESGSECFELLKGSADPIRLQAIISTTKEHMQQNFKHIVEDHVKEVFETFEIPQKCLELCSLEQKTEDRVAWRPTTGEVPIRPLIAKSLEKTKQKLQRRLDQYKKEADELQKLLNLRKSSFKKSMHDMENIIEIRKDSDSLENL